MRQMKDSGIEWIGEIPKTWNLTKLKNIAEKFCNGSSETQLSNGESIYPVTRIETISKGIVDYDKVGYVEYLPSRFKLEKNDFLVSNINSIAYLGNCAIYLAEKDLYHGMNLLRITPKNINVWYMFYYLKSMAFKRNMQIVCKPAINQASVSASNIKNMYIPLPSTLEQKEIAEYLTQKCSEFDSLISDIQSQIEVLEEYKRSVITEAVTKGLDPDVEMRDSGFEWLGFIPSTWQTRKGKYIFVQRNERGNSIELQLLSPTQKYGVIPQDLYEEISGYKAVKLDEKTDYSLLKTIHKGDYCISLRSFQGGFEYSEYEGVVSPAYQVFYPVIEVFRGYYKHLFKTQIFIDKMNSFTMSLRDGKNIAFADFGNTYLPIPPIKEQQQIADYLDSKCAEIDSIIAEKKQQIETIEEYKKSLIFEYVTGKKEVVV